MLIILIWKILMLSRQLIYIRQSRGKEYLLVWGWGFCFVLVFYTLREGVNERDKKSHRRPR